MSTATTQPKRRPATAAPVKDQSQPFKYAPEVEALRSDYERLAEALATIAELEFECPPRVLDVDGVDVESRDHLANGRHEHLQALWENLEWPDPRTMRRFYVEMRLWAKQLEFERMQRQAARREGGVQ